MALWKDPITSVKEPAKDPAHDQGRDSASGGINLTPPPPFSNTVTPEVPAEPIPFMSEPRPTSMAANSASARDPGARLKESVLTEELTIEGKIEGTGSVRIAGKFKGEVNVQGNLIIEKGALVTANVRAETITIAGQLEGNIDGATRVELQDTGVLTGDVTADTLTVAAGSRMRGKADFGWTEKAPRTL